LIRENVTGEIAKRKREPGRDVLLFPGSIALLEADLPAPLQ
jgi:hypothetical protein